MSAFRVARAFCALAKAFCLRELPCTAGFLFRAPFLVTPTQGSLWRQNAATSVLEARATRRRAQRSR